LEKYKLTSLNYYPEGKSWNILLANIFKKDRLKYKHKRNYDRMAYFMKYMHGNGDEPSTARNSW
jgi:hypothetical protein